MDTLSFRFRPYVLELGVFVASLAAGLARVVGEQFVIDRACLVNANFSAEICANLSRHDREEEVVQRIVVDFGVISTSVTIIPAVLTTLVLGAWSDTNRRRKPMLIAPMSGSAISHLWMLTLASLLPTAKVQWMLLSCLISGVSGAFHALMVGTFSKITDSTSEKTRLLRIFAAELCLIVGMSMGELYLNRI